MTAAAGPPPRVLIRRAGTVDLDAVARLHAWSQRTTYRDLLPPGGADDIDEAGSLATWQARLASRGRHTMLLAESDGDGLLGLGLITAEDSGWAALNALHVRPDRYGLGVGSALLGDLLAEARRWGRTRVHLAVLAENHQARRFYLHHGWTLAGDGPAHAIAGHPVTTLRYTLSLP
jgi:GNAT superfamily N-acetyltransferase